MSDGHVRVELPGATALFTSRRGGVSDGPYRSLNLGLWTEDDPDAVQQNRQRVAEMVDAHIVHGRQVHGARVAVLTEEPDPQAVPAQADGQATSLLGVAPLVLTADCLPIAVAGRGAVAMLHAGWRGLADGILAEGVRALRELGAEGPLTAAIGPGAGACCYEVGEEVHAAFAARGPAVRGPGRNLDLKAAARLALEDAGVGTVEDVGLCTICGDPDRWFSHRREHGLTGRQAGVVWRSS